MYLAIVAQLQLRSRNRNKKCTQLKWNRDICELQSVEFSRCYLDRSYLAWPQFSRTYNSAVLMHWPWTRERNYPYRKVRTSQDTRMYRKFDLSSSTVTLPPSYLFAVSACVKILSRQFYNRNRLAFSCKHVYK